MKNKILEKFEIYSDVQTTNILFQSHIEKLQEQQDNQLQTIISELKQHITSEIEKAMKVQGHSTPSKGKIAQPADILTGRTADTLKDRESPATC